jgi:hypothetical protein
MHSLNLLGIGYLKATLMLNTAELIHFQFSFYNRDIKKRLIDTQQAQQTRKQEEVRLDQGPSKASGSSSGGCC